MGPVGIAIAIGVGPSGSGCALVPRYNMDELLNATNDGPTLARQAFARGLCVLSDEVIAGGSSPSTIAVHNLRIKKTTTKVTLSKDIRNSIHGLEVWPFQPVLPEHVEARFDLVFLKLSILFNALSISERVSCPVITSGIDDESDVVTRDGRNAGIFRVSQVRRSSMLAQ